jgi:starvation-inducible DNA-binding protein
VRGYADEVAERIAALGGSPKGTPSAIVNDRSWNDYPLDRDCADVHLAALERVYSGVIADTRENIRCLEDSDVVTQDILIGHARELEKYQWFLRAHLETADGFISRLARGA